MKRYLTSEDQKMKQPSLYLGMTVAHQQTCQDQDGGRMSHYLTYFDSFKGDFIIVVTDYYESTVDKDLLGKLYMEGTTFRLRIKNEQFRES